MEEDSGTEEVWVEVWKDPSEVMLCEPGPHTQEESVCSASQTNMRTEHVSCRTPAPQMGFEKCWHRES